MMGNYRAQKNLHIKKMSCSQKYMYKYIFEHGSEFLNDEKTLVCDIRALKT